MAPGKDDMQILEAFHMFKTGENSQKKKKECKLQEGRGFAF